MTPYEFEYKKILLPCGFDKRIKLSKEDKKQVKDIYKSFQSQRKTAKYFGVSRRLIQFILDPDKQKENNNRRNERGGSMQYYDKNKHRIAMKKYRRRKQIILNGKGE